MKKGMISALSTAMGAIAGATIGAVAVGKKSGEVLNKTQTMSDKHLALYIMMSRWVKLKQQGKNLKDYFEKNNYKIIAVYGMSYVGECLVEELKNSEIVVKYGIDKNAQGIYTDINMVTLDEELEKVDAVIVTPIYFFNEIENELLQKIDCPIISIEDILYEISNTN